MRKNSPKSSRRTQTKYPNLLKKYNLKIRQDWVETEEYISGVRNPAGEEVIRPLKDDELAWLDEFNKEYVSGSFNSDSNEDLIKDRVEIYRLNNKRNWCIFSQCKASGRLSSMSGDLVDVMLQNSNVIYYYEDYILDQLSIKIAYEDIVDTFDRCNKNWCRFASVIFKKYPELIEELISESGLSIRSTLRRYGTSTTIDPKLLEGWQTSKIKAIKTRHATCLELAGRQIYFLIKQMMKKL